MPRKKTEPKTETKPKLKEEVYYEHDPLNQIDVRKTRMVEDK